MQSLAMQWWCFSYPFSSLGNDDRLHVHVPWLCSDGNFCIHIPWLCSDNEFHIRVLWRCCVVFILCWLQTSCMLDIFLSNPQRKPVVPQLELPVTVSNLIDHRWLQPSLLTSVDLIISCCGSDLDHGLSSRRFGTVEHINALFTLSHRYLTAVEKYVLLN